MSSLEYNLNKLYNKVKNFNEDKSEILANAINNKLDGLLDSYKRGCKNAENKILYKQTDVRISKNL